MKQPEVWHHGLVAREWAEFATDAGQEATYFKSLIETSGQPALDLGCGTGTLAIMIKQAYPGVEVYGLDPDEHALQIADQKARRARAEITLDRGMAQHMPYPDSCFDRVFSSLAIHHLKSTDKKRALDEAFRVLKPGAHLLIADFDKPHNPAAYVLSLVVRMLEETSDNIKGLIPEMIGAAGFIELVHQKTYMTAFGTLTLWKASKPQTPGSQVELTR